MRISAKCDYACRALLELALHWPAKEPLQMHAISEKQHIPIQYLVQILIQLKQMGLVDSVRGKEGGYNLLMAPNKISLGEVMRQIQGPFLPVSDSCRKNGSVFTVIWGEVEDAMTKVLDKVTFESVCSKVRGMSKTIIYQI